MASAPDVGLVPHRSAGSEEKSTRPHSSGEPAWIPSNIAEGSRLVARNDGYWHVAVATPIRPVAESTAVIPMIFPFATLVALLGVTTITPVPVDANAAVATADDTSTDTVNGPAPPLTTICGNGVASQKPPTAVFVTLDGVIVNWKTGVGVAMQLMVAMAILLFASAMETLIVVPDCKSFVSVMFEPLTVVSDGRSVATT